MQMETTQNLIDQLTATKIHQLMYGTSGSETENGRHIVERARTKRHPIQVRADQYNVRGTVLLYTRQQTDHEVPK